MGGLGIRTMHSKDKALLEKLEMKNTEGRRFVIGESSKRKTFKEGCRKLSAPRYDTSPPQDTTPDYFCLCVKFFNFFFKKKKKKKKNPKASYGTTLPHGQGGQELCLRVAKCYISSAPP